jgi:DNA-binding LytR/AlgR family response regulator
MKKISCLIVDDEPLALDLIERYVNKTSFLELHGRCSNAIETIDLINKVHIDLLFLDIQMPDLNGVELSRTFKNGPRVIFTTAFEKYALDGFKVDAIDYLLKPINYEEFLRAANKAEEWFRLKALPSTNPSMSHLFVKSEYKQVKIDLNDILFFEGLKDYVRIHLQSPGRNILSKMSLKLLEEQLPHGMFMRVHRSFIINLHKIETVERGQVIISKNRITVAEQYKEKFMQYISNKSISFKTTG